VVEVVKAYYIMIAGVGGQGTVMLSRIIGDAALMRGLHVRIGETYGAAMRGGAVHSHVKVGEEVHSPLLMEDEADALLALEPLEGLRRGLTYLKPEGVVVINTRRVYPIDVNVGVAVYPPVDRIVDALRRLGGVVVAHDFTALAEKAGTSRAMNVAVLGAFSRVIEGAETPFDREVLVEAMKKRIPKRWVEVNVKAFNMGYEVADRALK